MKKYHEKTLAALAKATACNTELERHRRMMEDETAKREKLVASGKFEDERTRAEIAECYLRCRMLPHRVAQFEQQLAELEAALDAAGKDLSLAVQNEMVRLTERLSTAGMEKIWKALAKLPFADAAEARAAAQRATAGLSWQAELRQSMNIPTTPARSVLTCVTPFFPLAEAVEKFCA